MHSPLKLTLARDMQGLLEDPHVGPKLLWEELN